MPRIVSTDERGFVVLQDDLGNLTVVIDFATDALGLPPAPRDEWPTPAELELLVAKK